MSHFDLSAFVLTTQHHILHWYVRSGCYANSPSSLHIFFNIHCHSDRIIIFKKRSKQHNYNESTYYLTITMLIYQAVVYWRQGEAGRSPGSSHNLKIFFQLFQCTVVKRIKHLNRINFLDLKHQIDLTKCCYHQDSYIVYNNIQTSIIIMSKWHHIQTYSIADTTSFLMAYQQPVQLLTYYYILSVCTNLQCYVFVCIGTWQLKFWQYTTVFMSCQ